MLIRFVHTLNRVVEPLNESKNGGLATATGTNKSECLRRWEHQIE